MACLSEEAVFSFLVRFIPLTFIFKPCAKAQKPIFECFSFALRGVSVISAYWWDYVSEVFLPGKVVTERPQSHCLMSPDFQAPCSPLQSRSGGIKEIRIHERFAARILTPRPLTWRKKLRPGPFVTLFARERKDFYHFRLSLLFAVRFQTSPAAKEKSACHGACKSPLLSRAKETWFAQVLKHLRLQVERPSVFTDFRA